MSRAIGNIYVSWRKGTGKRRHIVGVIRRNATEGVRFAYLPKAIEAAVKDGFVPYTEFPYIDKEYRENVLDKFGQRLTKPERPDYGRFLRFWEVPEKHKTDIYHLLAHTQGFAPTDNFEFLADFNPVNSQCFVSDLAALSIHKISRERIKVGDMLRFELEPTNRFDSFAVKVYKGDIHLGYIKKEHSRIFYKKGGKRLRIQVKDVDANGVIQRLFIRIYLPDRRES